MSQPTLNHRLLQAFAIFKIRENGNLEYWVSQLVVLTSTVLGVYLAAQAGYSTAIQFEVTRGEREAYYLRRALLDEVKSNLRAVDEWSASYEKALREKVDEAYFEPTDTWVTFFRDKRGWAHLGELTHPRERNQLHYSDSEKREALRLQNTLIPDELKMKTFVWDTMKQQVITFQLPPELLSAVRSYYDSMDGNVKDVRSNTEKTSVAAVAITDDTRRMRDEVVRTFEKEMAQLRSSLERKGVSVN
jgi:hypothetical protein